MIEDECWLKYYLSRDTSILTKSQELSFSKKRVGVGRNHIDRILGIIL